MKCIVGLGNPGPEYRDTKHNIGFAVVNGLAKDNHVKIKEKSHFSLMGKGRIAGQDVLLVLPQTYMNLSGFAVGELIGNKIKSAQDLVVVCDDINLELGKIRLKKHGSSGGHKGLESIIQTLGKDEFPRLRVGIATEVHRGDITRYVLSPFKRKDKRNVSHTASLAEDAIICLLEEGIDKAMSKFNRRKTGTS